MKNKLVALAASAMLGLGSVAIAEELATGPITMTELQMSTVVAGDTGNSTFGDCSEFACFTDTNQLNYIPGGGSSPGSVKVGVPNEGSSRPNPSDGQNDFTNRRGSIGQNARFLGCC